MCQNPVDTIAACADACFRGRSDSVKCFTSPFVASLCFPNRNPAAGLFQPGPCIFEDRYQLLAVLIGQLLFNVAVDINQKPLDQIEGQFSAAECRKCFLKKRAFRVKYFGERLRSFGSNERVRMNDCLTELMHAHSAMSFADDDLHSQSLTQSFDVDADLPGLSDVPHIEHQDGWQPQIQHLTEQIEVPFKIRRINDADDGVDLADVLLPPQQNFNRHHLVRSSWRKAVRSRKIDQVDCSVFQMKSPDFFLDGDSRKVARAGLHSGQRVKQCAFAGIWIADDSHFAKCGVDGGIGRGHEWL